MDQYCHHMFLQQLTLATVFKKIHLLKIDHNTNHIYNSLLLQDFENGFNSGSVRMLRLFVLIGETHLELNHHSGLQFRNCEIILKERGPLLMQRNVVDCYY